MKNPLRVAEGIYAACSQGDRLRGPAVCEDYDQNWNTTLAATPSCFACARLETLE